MKLRELAGAAPNLIGLSGDGDVEIRALCADTRRTADLQGSLFFCISGANFDGNKFARIAAEGGAVALAVEHLLPEIDLPQVQVNNIRVAMAYIAAAFYGNPAKSMRMFAVTGTKGKTTTTYLVKSVLERMGLKAGLIGTIGNMIGEKVLKSTLTTPDPLDLHQVLAEMRDELSLIHI